MINEVIILAGGLGTRLRSVVADQPKCMAAVDGKPFLHYVISWLEQQGINKFIFSLGYKHELIEDYIKDQYSNLNVQYAIEQEPLGTGGAIKLACAKSTEKNVLIVNGDTLFSIDVLALAALHERHQADCTIALKPMVDFERYGVVTLDDKGKISSFKEKKFYASGLINGGIYALNVESFLKKPFPDKFSFEKNYLEQYYNERKMYGLVQDKYFIDIGIPEDYARAQHELKIKN
ncbi:MAG: nucleotidyltransferase family protein [Ferruginibacter sp.]